MLRFFESAGKHRIYLRERGDLHILSRHEILDDIAADLVSGIERQIACRDRVIVYCGLHKRLGPFSRLRGFRVGIQTEHYFDEGGAFIGRRSWEIPKILKVAETLDAILDINPSNRPIYDQLPLEIRRKILFEPSIFPVSHRVFSAGNIPKAVFFGTLEGRRNQVFARLDQERFAPLGQRAFGDSLLEAIADYEAVLNVHYLDGVFSEAPRILLSLKAGKPLISERLSSEWTAGVHYLLPEDYSSEADLEGIYNAMAERCCNRYSFQSFLERTLPRPH